MRERLISTDITGLLDYYEGWDVITKQYREISLLSYNKVNKTQTKLRAVVTVSQGFCGVKKIKEAFLNPAY